MHELLVAMDVADEGEYAAYRQGMMPRVFTIRFPDRATKDAFYADPAYLAVKDRHFANAVRARTVLAEYTR